MSTITTTYLEIRALAALRLPTGGDAKPDEMHLEKADCAITCSAMYSAVGHAQYWPIYRCGWSRRHWQRHLQRPDLEVSLICNKENARLGYLELCMHKNASVEILNFGLLPEFIGHGFGGQALALAVRRGLALGTAGVWLHTCSLDHPAALRNYYARGFTFVRQEERDHLRLDPAPAPVDHSAAAT
jgi:ribosomal protein S18 acetylase RimI-like enzyme